MIYDRLRGKHVALTPEEGVRQWFVDYLIETCGYPEGLMANEVALTTRTGLRRRCDTVVYDRCGRPSAIIEYKAPDVKISPKVFDQIARYNLELSARWLIVTNGRAVYCCHVDDSGHTEFSATLPTYEQICSTIEG